MVTRGCLQISQRPVQRSIILKRSLRNRCFVFVSAIWAIALHYQQYNRSTILSGRVFLPNAFKSLIPNERHYFAFHVAFLTMLVLTNDEALREQALLQILYKNRFGARIRQKTAFLIKICEIQVCGIIDYCSAKDAQLAHPGGREPHDKAQRIVILCTRRSLEQLISDSRNIPDMRCLSTCNESEYQAAPLDSFPMDLRIENSGDSFTA